MFDKIIKIISLTIVIAAFLAGLLSIYRATLKTTDMIVIAGKVISKKISYFKSIRSGRHYSVAFELANRAGKIAINLGTKNEAANDSAFYLIDTGKVYTFYLDPTVPTQNGVNKGIYQIDYNNKEVYRRSNNFNLYGGIIITLVSLVGIIFLVKFKKKEKKTTGN